MTRFHWLKAFGFGLIIWAIMFLVGLVLAPLGVLMSTWALTLLALAAGIISYAFAANTATEDYGYALGYGVIWAAIGVILDALISTRMVAGLFNQWQYWVGYALVLLAPMAQLYVRGGESKVSEPV